MDANKFFGSVSKIPVVGEFVIGCAIYLVLSVAAGTTDKFGLPEPYSQWLQYIFLYIAIFYFVTSLCYRLWKFVYKNPN
ncbi:MAG: hypothetical protein GX780_00665 [Campylobacteraceae bacterium]|nr:hypothetical protein [Campylobacteraceae bacterium]